MAQSLPSPWPGAYAAPSLVTDKQVAQGVISGNTTAKLNEITQVEKGLVWFNPSVAPLLRLITKLKNPKSVENSRFYHLEKQRLPREVTLTAVEDDDAPTDVTVSVAESARVRAGDLLYNTTSEKVARVQSVDYSTGVITLADASVGTTDAANDYVIGHVLLNIGNVYLDGSGSGSPLVVVEDEKIFYTQIFKDSIEYADRYLKTALYEGDPWTNARKQLEQEHTLSIEHAMFFGKPSITQDGTTKKFITTMGGLDHYLSVNRVDFDGDTSTTKAFMDSILVEAMREGHSGYENKEMATKTMFASHKWLKALNTIAEDQIRIVEPSQKTFGLRIAQYQGSWGVLNLINAPVLNRSTLSGKAFILDFEHLRPANFKGRDTKFQDNIQDPDVDGKKAQYISDKSLVVEITPAHTVLENLG